MVYKSIYASSLNVCAIREHRNANRFDNTEKKKVEKRSVKMGKSE